MISYTCLIAPTGVPVEVITHCTPPEEPPCEVCKLLPAGQVVGVADDGVVPTKAVEIPTPETVAIITATSATTVRRRYFVECKSFISQDRNEVGLRESLSRSTKVQLLCDHDYAGQIPFLRAICRVTCTQITAPSCRR